MSHHLKTDWKRYGRSGETVDGRVISEQDIIDAAETYDPTLYTALVWPDHQRWFNMGKVLELRAEDNEEGGKDLFGILAPNDYYLSINAAGQRLFTSMELQADFRGTGRTYLTGLGATDNPASAATQEQRFSRVGNNATKFGDYTENTTHDFNDSADDDQPPGWFNKLFKFSNQESDMDKEALAAVKTDLAALTEKFTALAATLKKAKPEGNGSSDEPDKFAALERNIAALTEKFTALDARVPAQPAESDQFDELKTALDTLTEKFNAAVGEQGGTDAGEDTGGNDLIAYI